jgi:Tol biopolymer transport system component
MMRRLLVLVSSGLSFCLVTPLVPASAAAPATNGRIVFVRDRPSCDDCVLITVDPDGTDPLRIDDASTARWSPDGSRLVSVSFTDDRRVGTMVFDADGSNRTVLDLPDATLNLPCAAWSPDGERLACEGWDDANPDRAPGIFTVDASDGGNLERVTRNRRGGHDIPADYSPDGSQLVFLRENTERGDRNKAWFVVDAGGGNLLRLTRWLTDTTCCQASWSPDGSSILFARGGHLATIPSDGSSRSTIVPLRAGRGFTFAYQPAWSPDGARIVFSMYRSRVDQVDLYTASSDGTHVEQVTDGRGADEFADWGTHPTAGG